MQSIIKACENVRTSLSDALMVASISDILGLAIAKKSILDYVMDTWGKIVGGAKLREIVTQRIERAVNLSDL